MRFTPIAQVSLNPFYTSPFTFENNGEIQLKFERTLKKGWFNSE